VSRDDMAVDLLAPSGPQVGTLYGLLDGKPAAFYANETSIMGLLGTAYSMAYTQAAGGSVSATSAPSGRRSLLQSSTPSQPPASQLGAVLSSLAGTLSASNAAVNNILQAVRARERLSPAFSS
jgi:hypothetical protein